VIYINGTTTPTVRMVKVADVMLTWNITIKNNIALSLSLSALWYIWLKRHMST